MIGTEIIVNDDFKIVISERNYNLKHKIISKKGNERWESEGYFQEIDILLDYLIELDVMYSIESLEDILIEVRRVKGECLSAIEQMCQ